MRTAEKLINFKKNKRCYLSFAERTILLVYRVTIVILALLIFESCGSPTVKENHMETDLLMEIGSQ